MARGQHILLDAVAVSDAASRDSLSLTPHLDRLFRQHPQLWGTIRRVLYDGAADDAMLKADIAERFGIELTTPINPRRRRLPEGARQISVAFERLPWINPAFPQLSQRFHKTIAQRTAIERIHKLMKYDLADARLSKRDNTAFQARLDKTLLAMHLLLAQT